MYKMLEIATLVFPCSLQMSKFCVLMAFRFSQSIKFLLNHRLFIVNSDYQQKVTLGNVKII